MYWTAGLLVALAITQVAATIQPAYIENTKGVAPVPANSRIVSGWDAQDGQIPFQTSIRIVMAGGGVSGCGASVIHEYWLISAAHCTAGHLITIVRAGLTSMLRPEYMHETTEWYNYPTFNVNTPTIVQPDDISIIKLVKPVTYSARLQPVRIQPRDEAFKDYTGVLMTASGFGMTWTQGSQSEILQWVHLVGVNNSDCAALFGPTLVNDAAICAGFYNVTSQSTCQGDSGGPLFYYNEEEQPILIGIASFVAGGNFGCHSGLPAGFARPGPYHDWIQAISGIDFDNLEIESTEAPAPETTTLSTTEVPQTTSPITTLAPLPTPDPEDEDEDDDDSEEDPEIAELLKKIIVKVKVKININDEIKKKVKAKCVHTM